jgi:hypothetical protein
MGGSYQQDWDDCLDTVLRVLQRAKDMKYATKKVEDLQVLVKTKKFEQIKSELGVIGAEVSAMPQVQAQVSSRFLPMLNVLGKLGRSAAAAEVAAITGCSRAHESMFLNELVGRGISAKEKQGRKRLFRVKDDAER